MAPYGMAEPAHDGGGENGQDDVEGKVNGLVASTSSAVACVPAIQASEPAMIQVTISTTRAGVDARDLGEIGIVVAIGAHGLAQTGASCRNQNSAGDQDRGDDGDHELIRTCGLG